MRVVVVLLCLSLSEPAVARSAVTLLFPSAADEPTNASRDTGERSAVVSGAMEAHFAAALPRETLAPAQCLDAASALPPSRPSLSTAASDRRAAYWPDVLRAACRHGLPPELLDSVIIAESAYSPSAVSHAGAAGLAQLMPATARYLGVSDRFDPSDNVHGGALYLRQMLDRFASLPLALAAYNAGPGAVKRVGRIPRNGETPAYVARVLSLFAEARRSDAAALRRALSIRWDNVPQ